MELTSEFKIELLAALDGIFQKIDGEKPSEGNAQSQVTDFQQNTTGADTTIFAFNYQYMGQSADSIAADKILDADSLVKIPLILRIYGRRSIDDGFRQAEWELQVLQALFTAKLPVPQAYYAGKSVMNVAYVVMEQIEGIMQSTMLLEANKNGDMELIGHLFHQFIGNLAMIHKVDVKTIKLPNISGELPETSMAFSTKLVSKYEHINSHYNLDELMPIVDWIKKRLERVTDEKPVLVHGDYHPANIIVKEDNSAIILDWADFGLGDYRMDLGFAIGILKGNGIDVTDVLVGLYQQYSGKTLVDLELFILLSHYKNFMRIYSMINNYAITGENDQSKKVMLGNYSAYGQYLYDLVVSTTGIEVPSVANYFANR